MNEADFIPYNCSLIGHSSQLNSHTLNNADDLKALKEFQQEIDSLTSSSKQDFCEVKEVGSNNGVHTICLYKQEYQNIIQKHYQNPCFFFSFGVFNDYSFDSEMDEKYHCRGVAFDPTVSFPMNLTQNVIFWKAGAHSPRVHRKWSVFSVPRVRTFFNTPLYVLKMDCEGCEYSLAYDILHHDPTFFDHVLQFNIELHFPRGFMRTEDDVYALGRLYRLMKLANMKLVHMDNGVCAWLDARHGCQPLFVENGMKCDPGCRSFLFVKDPSTFKQHN